MIVTKMPAKSFAGREPPGHAFDDEKPKAMRR